MSIETAAKDLASRITSLEQVEIICHHDADGIAAGAIMGLALYRAHIPFRLRVTPRIESEKLPGDGNNLLCDLGSGLSDLPEDTMVIDHHLPRFEGPYHVNPRLAGIDADRELSGAGAAYLVANAMGDNRNLAGLVLTGIIGDDQQLIGKNREIYLEGMGNGIITNKRGIRLPGRDLPEKLIFATHPFIPGISGCAEEITSLIRTCTPDGEGPALDLLLSMLLLKAAEVSNPDTLLNLYGDTYQLEREVVPDAHTMTMLIDACGKEGEGSIAAAICFRSSGDIPRAWEIATSHRMRLITELQKTLAKPGESPEGIYEISDKRLASDVADIMNGSMDSTGNPTIVFARQDNGMCHLSIRVPPSLLSRNGGDLGTLVHTIAEECGGYGGGHTTRAGATIACGHLSRFITDITQGYA
jgi:single-stranded DNA-specific DHH superfamily exonuclease